MLVHGLWLDDKCEVLGLSFDTEGHVLGLGIGTEEQVLGFELTSVLLLCYRCVASFRNVGVSKKSGVEDRGQISHFFTPIAKIRRG